ncbi:sugar transferase [Agrilactobacillus fermenti]|uniref:sugar transferase n=1 Tax=Agrilactobacillus fermenti TaxID=2586909 RepID=UPI003A5C5162
MNFDKDTSYTELEHQFYRRIGKRIFDIAIAVTGLTILSPVFLIIAVLIKIEDPKSPVIYTQVRVGFKRQRFNMYKFRSMVVGADKKIKKLIKYNEVDGAMFKMKHDPRVTHVGHFIREYSLDELPQLWNVLKGDMSFIGPRPPLVREVRNYSLIDMKRLQVKPGCTGLWQVSGRNKLSFKQMVELDLIYINDYSFAFDLKIFFKTFYAVLSSDGAY